MMSTQLSPADLGDVGRVEVVADFEANTFTAYASWRGTDDGLYDAKATADTMEAAIEYACEALDSEQPSRRR
jgi:hypothetical protein